MLVQARRLGSAALGAAAVFLFTAPARADDTGYPLSFVERPLTLPRLTLAPEADFSVTRFPGVTVNGVAISPSSTTTFLRVGATFGVTNDFEVGAFVLPLQFSPSVAYTTPTVEATYRFLRGPFELGARLEVGFATQDPTGYVATPGVPLLIHIGNIARIDTGVFVPIWAYKNGPTVVDAQVPVRFSFQVIEPLHIGANTGVSMQLTDPGPGQTVTIPLGVFFGYAVGGKKPIVDIDPFFNFAEFLTPGVGAGSDKVNPGIFTAGVNARGYLYF